MQININNALKQWNTSKDKIESDNRNLDVKLMNMYLDSASKINVNIDNNVKTLNDKISTLRKDCDVTASDVIKKLGLNMDTKLEKLKTYIDNKIKNLQADVNNLSLLNP